VKLHQKTRKEQELLVDKAALAALAAQLQQVVSTLQTIGGEEGDYGAQVQQPIPTWASIDARIPVKPYQPLVSRQKHLIDIASELAASQAAPSAMSGPDEYGMPQDDMGAAYSAMGVM
jgi:hypothetical protein